MQIVMSVPSMQSKMDTSVNEIVRFNKVTIKKRLKHHNRIPSESSVQQCWEVQMFQSIKYMTCLISCNNVVALIFILNCVRWLDTISTSKMRPTHWLYTTVMTKNFNLIFIIIPECYGLYSHVSVAWRLSTQLFNIICRLSYPIQLSLPFLRTSSARLSAPISMALTTPIYKHKKVSFRYANDEKHFQGLQP